MIKREVNQQLDRKNKNRSHMQQRANEQQRSVDTITKLSFKQRFIEWLKQLPLDQRYLALKVFAPGLSRRIQQSLIDLQSSSPQTISKPLSSDIRRINYRQSKQLLQSLVLISDGEQYFDNVGFDFSYIQHPQRVFQLLTINLSVQQKISIVENDSLEEQSFTLKEVLIGIEKCATKEELLSSVISFLRTEIFGKFRDKKPICVEEQRNRKKEFSMFWRNLTEQNKRKILLLHKDDLTILSTYLAEKHIHLSPQDLQTETNQLLQMDKNEFCNKIFKCKLKKSLTYFTDYHELVYKLWKSELKKKKKYKMQKNIEKSSNSLNRNLNLLSQKPQKRNYNKNQKQHQKIEFIIQKDKSKNNHFITTNQQQKSARNHNNQQNQKPSKPINQLLTSQQNNQNQRNQNSTKPQNNSLLNIGQANQAINNVAPKRKRNRNNRRKKSVSAQSKQTNTTSHKFEKQEKQVFERKIEEETSIIVNEPVDTLPSVYRLQQKQSSDVLTEQTLNDRILTQQDQCKEDALKINSLTDQGIDQLTYPQLDFTEQIKSKIKSDIQEYSDLINQEANQFYDRRLIAYERIQFILGMWKIPIKLFGSCASGITIKNSDIDIAVDNSILNYFIHLPENNRLKGALEQLEQLLQQLPWVTSIKLIKTAAIPVIKLKVNTSINFTQIPGFEIFPAYLEALNREHSSAGEIHIDLTIQTINKELQCNHLGIISTDQVNSWLKSIKSLHPIVIIIKNYLTKTNLNITYEGGLNTYSMICMIVAFIKENKLEEQTDVVKVFEQLLKFYAFEFDQKTHGIDLLNEKQIFYDKLTLKQTKSAHSEDHQKLPDLSLSKSTPVFCQADLQIKDPLNDGKIMTKNCYSFPKIREIFQKIYQACFVEQKKALETIFKEKFRAKNMQNFAILAKDSKEVRQLLEECKNSLSNPFLTLFE